jgi:adenylate cyclase
VGVEIERKWRVSEIPGGLPEGTPLRQGYLTRGGDTEVRLRDKGGACVLTVKRGAGLRREEVEVDLDRAQFEALWPLTAGARVEKTRYKLPAGGLTIELDVFEGALTGLTLAEVEFPDEASAVAFDAPGWFGEDLTGRPGWSNGALARQGLPDEPQ